MKLVSHRGRNLSPLWSDSDLTGAAYLAALRDWDWIFESFHFMSYGAFSTRRKDWFGPTQIWYPIRLREASLSMDIFSFPFVDFSFIDVWPRLPEPILCLILPPCRYLTIRSPGIIPRVKSTSKAFLQDIWSSLILAPGKSRKGMMKLPLRPTLSFAPFGEYSGKLVLTATWVLRSHF